MGSFMPTVTNAKTQNLKNLGHLLWEYSFYLRQELRNPTVLIELSTHWIPAVSIRKRDPSIFIPNDYKIGI